MAYSGTTTVVNAAGDKATCVKGLKQLATGSVEDIAEFFGPEATNREAKDEPPATRGKGPEAIHATALWLREAHADLRWDVHDAVQEGELVVLHATMSGRQAGTFTAYAEDASVKMVFPRRAASSPSPRPTGSG